MGEPVRGNGRDTNRLEAFSDGVIAIAITLLVLEIRVPEAHGAAELWRALWELWPAYLGYLISFLIIGIMWANHHTIFRYINRTDHYLVVINLLLLLCIAFIPFPTALLAEYLGHSEEQVGGIVYSGAFFVTALVYNLLWLYPRRAGLLDPAADPEAVRGITRRFRLGPPTYLLACLLSFLTTEASLLVLFLVALLYVLPYAAREG